MRKPGVQGRTVQDYLKKFPKVGTLTLAKKIYKENRDLFTNLEGVRIRIRYYRGAAGKENRTQNATTEFFRVTPTHNPFALPEEEQHDTEPFILPSDCKNTLILADLQIPYHSIEAITAGFGYGKKHKVDSILLLGDVPDWYGISRFQPDPRKRDVAYEVEAVKKFFESLDKQFPNARKFWKLGNHCIRWEQNLIIKAPELLDVPDFELGNLMKCEDKGIEIITDRRIVRAGGLTLLHGHELGIRFSNPVNPARGLFLKGYSNAVCGHFHQTSEHMERDMNDKIITCWSLGCLCQLRPEFLPVNKWNHGFGLLKRDNKSFQFKNIRIYNGQIL